MLNSGGIEPEKLFLLMSSLRRFRSLPIWGGMWPEKRFPLKSRIWRFVKLLMEMGRDPEKRLLERFRRPSLEGVGGCVVVVEGVRSGSCSAIP